MLISMNNNRNLRKRGNTNRRIARKKKLTTMKKVANMRILILTKIKEKITMLTNLNYEYLVVNALLLRRLIGQVEISFLLLL